MSYQLHDFQSGDVLLASQLNEMDNQIAKNSELIITPELYGAVGDGVTDDTLAIQSMFNETRAGTIIFNADSSYLVTDTITIYSGYTTLNVLLSSIFYDGTSDNRAVIEIVNDVTGVDNKGRGGIKLFGGYINANKKAGCGLRLKNCYHPVINGVKIANYMQYGIDIGYPNPSSPISMQAMIDSCYIDNYSNGDIGTAIHCYHTDNNISNVVTNRGFYSVELEHGGQFFSNCHFTLGVSSGVSLDTPLYTFIHNAVSSGSEQQTNSFTGCYFNGRNIQYVIKNDINNLTTILLSNCSLILGTAETKYITRFRSHEYNSICVDELNIRHNANNPINSWMFIGGNISASQQTRFSINSGMLHNQENYDIANMGSSPVSIIDANNVLPANTLRRIARVSITAGSKSFSKINVSCKGIVEGTIYCSNDSENIKINSSSNIFYGLKFYRSVSDTEEIDGETIRFFDIWVLNNTSSNISSLTFIQCENQYWPYCQTWTHRGNELDYIPTSVELNSLKEIKFLSDNSKNLIIYPYVNSSKEVNGITFTVNNDGTILASGTATSDTTFLLCGWAINDGSIPLNPNITYKLTGSPVGASTSTYFVACRIYTNVETPSSSTGQIKRDEGNGVTWSGASYVSIYIAVKNGQTVNDLLFKPMLTYDGVDDTYEEYGESIIPYLAQAIANTKPSNSNPQMDGSASPGLSSDYARADHVHPSDTSKLDVDAGAEMITLIPNGATVSCSTSFVAIYGLFTYQKKCYFILPRSQTDVQVFAVERVDAGNQTVYLSSILGGVLTQIVLTASGSSMTGTLTTIDLNLQSAQGVNF